MTSRWPRNRDRGCLGKPSKPVPPRRETRASDHGDFVRLRPRRESLRRVSALALSRVPIRALDYLDAILQEAQGKGWGYSGVNWEVRGLAQLLERYGHGPPSLALDIGANVGEWAAEARRTWPGCRLICFEPSSLAARKLSERFAHDPRLGVERVAVASAEGQLPLFSNHEGSALSSLRQRRLEHFDVEFNTVEHVAVTTIDAYLAAHQKLPDVDIIKVDVEGFEMEVLQGAEECLKYIKAVQFEWGEASTGSPVHWVDFWYFWRDRGLDVYRISPRGTTPVTRYHPRDEVMTWTNYIAIRPDPVVRKGAL